MNKYDKMLELNKKKSEEKVTSAVNDSFIKIRLSEVKLIVH